MEDEFETHLVGSSMVPGQLMTTVAVLQIAAETVSDIQVPDWMTSPQRVRTSKAKLTIISSSLSTHVQTTSTQHVRRSY